MKRFLIILCVLLPIACDGTSTTETKALVEYGAKCGTYFHQSSGGSFVLECNAKFNMECNYYSKTCVCTYDRVYDKDRKMCRAGVGSNCYRNSDKDFCLTNSTCRPAFDPDQSAGPASLMRSYYKLMKYQRYWACQCSVGFVETGLSWGEQRECRLARNFGQSCSRNYTIRDLQCAKGLICNKADRCDCENSTTMAYNKDLSRCVTPLGQSCSTWRGEVNPCGMNAVCSNYVQNLREMAQYVRRDDHEDYRDSWSNKDERRCICAPGFTSTKAGQCFASYKVGCSKQSDCNTERFLTCVNGACQCQNGTAHLFSVVNSTCNIRAKFDCSEKTGPRCVENSTCKDGHCTCVDGFSAARDGRCLLTHSSNCSAPTRTLNSTLCNHYQGLGCVNATCQCYDASLSWSSEIHMCIAQEGKQCGLIRDGDDAGGYNAVAILQKDYFYPFATSSSTGISYTVECDLGFTCIGDHLDSKWRYCRKWDSGKMAKALRNSHSTDVFKLLFVN